MFRKLFALLSLGALSMSPMLGCAPDSTVDEVERADDDDSALSVPFEELDVTKSPSSDGLTVIKKKSEFIAFFGQQPPPGLSFNQSWVLHYSAGVKPTGGYGTSIVSVERDGKGNSAHLVVKTEEVSPGDGCIVTQALTNPQTTVKIPKQKSGVVVDLKTNQVVEECGPDPDAFCPKVKCANGYECDENVDACVGRHCDPNAGPTDGMSCPTGFACENQIQCIKAPCPEDFRCEPVAAPPPQPDCATIGWVGTCDGAVLSYCIDDVLHTVDCSPGSCGFVPQYAYYDCQ